MKTSSSSSESPSGHASGGDCSDNGTRDRYSASASNSVPWKAHAAGAPAHRTLADTILALRFDPAEGLTTAHYGRVFGRCRPAIFDALITDLTRRRDYPEVIRAKRVSELAGYDSPIITSCLKEALSEIEMLGYLPRTADWERGFFGVTRRYLLHAYRYARELGHEREKWDPDKAREEFGACLHANERKAFLGCNPTDNSVFRPGFRYYDENMETLDVFLKLDELMGDHSSMEDILAIWTTVNETHWTGDHYYYQPTVPVYECETGFFILAAYLNSVVGFALPHFDRCAIDLWFRLLESQWQSPNWRDYVSQHADTNEQKRLNNTLISFFVLHAYYPLLSANARAAFRGLLVGSLRDGGTASAPRAVASPAANQPRAWEGLVNRSGLYADGRFRRNDTYGSTDPSDEATAMGSMLLFLQGIIPDSGSLAMPLIEETYEDPIGGLVLSHFGMDASRFLVRIPVWKGSMAFQFGTETVAVDFDREGIYELTFSDDWNRLTFVERRESLAGSRYRYVQRTEGER